MYRHVMGPGIGTYSVHHCRSYRVKITPRIHRNDAIDTWTVGNCHPKSAYIQYQGTANLIRTWVCTCKTLESRKGRDLKKSKADRTICRESLVIFEDKRFSGSTHFMKTTQDASDFLHVERIQRRLFSHRVKNLSLCICGINMTI